MRIALAQINTTVGAFEQNLDALRQALERAAAEGVRLVVAPELLVTGYPPRDFLAHRSFVREAADALNRWLAKGTPKGVTAYFGTVEAHEGEGAGLYNAALLVEDGQVVARARKSLLPTYDVFDEGRYFDPATETTLVELDGVPVGLTICEDLWNDERFWSRRRYVFDPVQDLVSRGARLIVNASASPYSLGKPEVRRRMIAAAARRHGVPVLMSNLVGGNDALVFDGGSLAFDGAGALLAEAPEMKEAFVVVDVAHEAHVASVPPATNAAVERDSGEGESVASVALVGAPDVAGIPRAMTPLVDDVTDAQLDQLHDALVLGLRDYLRKTGFKSALVGLSGGMDSALVAVLAVRALSPDRVFTVALPSRYTASMSNDDAQKLAENLGVDHISLPIEAPVQAHLQVLADPFAGRAPDLAEENVQARVRGALLMALSNKFGHLLLTTGNKSEIATGYCTLYGDMAGGIAVIGDVPKTLVYALARRINAKHRASTGGDLIPERIITRPPSAELRDNQTDQDSLPPYEVLDRVLRRYVEAQQSAVEIEAAEPDIERATIDRILSLIRNNEYKRRQAAPVIRVTPRAFGEGWRFPMAHGYRG